MTTIRIRGAKMLLALAVTGVALGAVAPVEAQVFRPRPKLGCLMYMPDGTYVGFPHGDTVTIRSKSGLKETYRCNDGKWEKVPTVFGNATIVVGGSLEGAQP
jgi:hypothetical protein